ncbi:PREDICTED: bifunctional glutamate/proline--tRNA ligase [Rhagoletis zephyria]|uniref:bifunctional glutamate/proline--tRNA ligase n=1 Tax=Rhagoletis zephyria TaxID=28612 RepID=UPI0008113735|nr:PREDICTED: bifunctional glutamate/proline--tRNA ligase [Rhagoletis zephyria]
MKIKLTANINNPPISGLATAHLINETVPIEIVWGNETSLKFPDNRHLFCHSNNDVLRALARAAPEYQLYGKTAIERTQIDHWLSFSLTCEDDISWAFSFLDKSIAPVTYLVANKLTIADFALFNEMHARYEFLSKKGIPQHVQRWYDLINAQPFIQKVLQTLPEEARAAAKHTKRSNGVKLSDCENSVLPGSTKTNERKQEGKFIELPGAEMGKVVVRFPPEASGYLHIGHAKAALLNQYYALNFNGKLIMRFDDTNPAKETVEFEEVILGDVELLQIKPNLFTHTSNYFDLMLQYCEQMITEGKAYVDDTPAEQMKLEREQRIESTNRSNDVEKNLLLWQEMKNGTEIGQKCCVRAKIDMSSPNGCMRDPTIYRCKNEPHPRTGTKYNSHISTNSVWMANNYSPVQNDVLSAVRTDDASTLDQQIIKQGEKIRDLKAKKVSKDKIDPEIQKLIALKADYKVATGTEWKPGQTAAVNIANTGCTVEKSVSEDIVKLGNLIRDLKAKKASKTEIDTQVKALLDLKAKFKALTGNEWKPVDVVSPSAPQSKNSSGVEEVLKKINTQGDKVRQLKSQKADKVVVEAEVKTLLALKTEYKELTGSDWKPGVVAPATIKKEKSPDPPSTVAVRDLLTKINAQGDKVRSLKNTKAEKNLIEDEVKLLLALKTDYKSLTGQDWKPGTALPLTAADGPVKIDLTRDESPDANALLIRIQVQGEKIRKLKSEKYPKQTIDAEVQSLLALKAAYKQQTGTDWTPNTKVQPNAISVTQKSPVTMSSSPEKELLTKEINEQGDKVRAAKSNNLPKEMIDAEVKKLLALKAKYKEVTGTDFPTAGGRGSSSSSKKGSEKKAPATKKETTTSKEETVANVAGLKKQTRLGLEATKEENLPDWYSQVITKGELIEYYDVSGCYILRHWSFAIWKFIKSWFDAEITKMGVKECYFPIFVSRAALEREKTHIDDFAPEVAWVTKSGDSDLAEPIAVRPTSETVMYPAYAKWIQSYRDLPLRLNQWNNVVRWEFKHPQPFLRTREFLWQEGHTAFATKAEADQEVLEILDRYAQIYTNLLAIPVVKGRKTEKEKFAGADYTTTVEAFISASGRAIQGGTSHHLGQNFSKMFEIVYEDPETQQKQFVYQNSWGITTRTIGVMIMVHGDNQGLVLPPRVACIQAIIVPCGITVNTKEEEREQLLQACKKIENQLNTKGIRCEGDYRDNYSPGWKFNHWELKGVPLRIELGPKDMKANQLVAVRRDTGEKLILALEDVESKISQLLETIHDSMLAKAKKDMVDHTKITKIWIDFCKFLDAKHILLSPFCGEIGCEEKIKADSARDEESEPGAPAMGAKSLCIPFDQPATITPADKCIHPSCTNKPKFYTLFGRSY